MDDLSTVSARKVSSADASCEECVAGEHHFQRRKVKADGALRMSGSVQNLGGVGIESNAAAVGEELVGRRCFRRINADPGSLFSHDFELGKVVLIHVDGSAGE